METKLYAILIVEDESIVAEDLRLLLEQFGYIVTGVCSSGEDAIVAAQKRRPDLILMDINLMGALNGIETAEQIRSTLDVPIVFLTAYADDATLERARIAAKYGYILKPFESREIRLSVEVALHKHASERKTSEADPVSASADRAPAQIESVDFTATAAIVQPSERIIDQCRELREIIRQKDRLFGILSEDRASPKNMLLHYCEQILESSSRTPAGKSDNDNRRAAASESDSSDQHLADEEADKYISLPTERLQLSDQIAITANWFKTRLQSKAITLRQPETDVRLEANPKLLQFILRHTFMAAIDFTPQEGIIEVQSRQLDAMAEVSLLFPCEGSGAAGTEPSATFGVSADELVGTLKRNPSLEHCGKIVRLQGGAFVISCISETRIRLAFTVPSSTAGAP
jgi:CheY-like chemotaxis protein